MQWDKVKNVLIVILAAVNLFLLGNLERASGRICSGRPNWTAACARWHRDTA